MKRIIIVCEGQTEQEFCNNVLRPHFLNLGIIISAPTIKKTRGGIVSWELLKRQLNNHLLENAVVTSLLDYYGIKDKHTYPNWEAAKAIVDPNERMDFLENSMSEEIENKFRYKFHPYLQVHEFEGLLFNNMNVFDKYLDENDFKDKTELERIINTYANPELINNNPETAPSKRLEKLIYGYNKVLYGNILAIEIGLERIRTKCPRFNKWISKLEQV